MAKNLTQIHKKLDRLIEKMSAIDETQTLVRQMAQTNRYLANTMPLLMEMQHDTAVMAQEALKASRESAERTAEILRAIRTQ
jgi:hypothetical protein